MLFEELDFIKEGLNSERFASIFKDNPQIITPKIHWDKTSKRILTMQYMEGVKITEKEKFKAMGISEKEVAELLVNAYSEMNFVQGLKTYTEMNLTSKVLCTLIHILGICL